MTGAERVERVALLRRSRPRRLFARACGYGLALLAAWSWLAAGLSPSDLFSSRRVASLERFMAELAPFPLRETGVTVSGWLGWAGDLLADRGLVAALATLGISVVAVVLAAALGAALTLGAVRSLAAPAPFLPGARSRGAVRRWGWRLLNIGTRLLLAFLRAIPEYVWVFLLIAMLGPTPWAAIVALALHNGGILGRLNSEVIEDLEPQPLIALRALGASRRAIAGWGVVPVAMPRLLLFFFYRWESCVREATVLGLLGIVSIGYWIQDARARQQIDTMLFFIVLGALLVIGADLLSAWARRWVREAR